MIDKLYKKVKDNLVGTVAVLLIPGSIVVIVAVILYHGYRREKEEQRSENVTKKD